MNVKKRRTGSSGSGFNVSPTLVKFPVYHSQLKTFTQCAAK
jgi:hypothetical protein